MTTAEQLTLTLNSPPKSSNGFTPSPYQQAIFDSVRQGTDGPDLFVSAVAGSGKTTTIVQAARFIDAPGLFAAFNVAIVDELNRRLDGTQMSAINFHKIGKRALDRHVEPRVQVDRRKYLKLARAWVEGHVTTGDSESRRALGGALADLAGFARKTLTDPADTDAVFALADHYDILTIPEDVSRALSTVLQQGQDLARREGTIDFDDMLYLPVAWNLPLQQFEWVFVDEAQDLSPAQLELVLRCRAPGGRMVFVGDERQAIYGFAGADNRSVERIVARVNAQRLPLSICYRCPTAHLDLAREIVPAIEARPGAPAGELRTIAPHELDALVRPGDLVICRLTAPLVEQCIHFITRGISARVEGRDIGKALTQIVRKVAERRGFTYGEITAHLVAHKLAQTALLRQKGADEDAIQSLEDRVEAVLVCVASFEDARDVDTLCARIEGLFDERRPQIRLATVHRTKGLEAERVFILRPDKLPLARPDQQPWQREQEMNLKYVALTRAKQSLFFVDEDAAELEAEAKAEPDEKSESLAESKLESDSPGESAAESESATESQPETAPAAAEANIDPAALLTRIAALETRVAALETALAALTEKGTE